MKECLTPSQRMTAAWEEMIKDNFNLVHVYFAMSPQEVSEMIKTGNINLPEGQKPIADYLKAVGEYAPLPQKR
ncbi:MAG: hypothetical protein ABH816_01465 [Candidatus Levyibacteriota bacterium]